MFSTCSKRCGERRKTLKESVDFIKQHSSVKLWQSNVSLANSFFCTTLLELPTTFTKFLCIYIITWHLFLGRFLVCICSLACEWSCEWRNSLIFLFLKGFLNNLDSLHYFIDHVVYKANLRGPSFRCEDGADNTFILHYLSSRSGLYPIVKGKRLRIRGRFLMAKEGICVPSRPVPGVSVFGLVED